MLVLVSAGLAAVPALPAAAESPSPEDLLAPAKAFPAPLPLAERIPVPVRHPEIGVENPDQVAPSLPEVQDPQDAVAGLTETSSGDGYSLYAEGPGKPAHTALLQVGSDEPPPLARSGAGWSGTSGQASIFLPRHLSSSSPVKASFGEGSLKIAPVGVAKTTGHERPDGIAYPNAEPGTTYTYRLVPGGYKEDVLLESAQTDADLSWAVTTSDLWLSLDSGTVLISGASGPLAQMPAPEVTDAGGALTVATYSLSPQPGGFLLSVEIPQAFLAAAAFPVTVDPGAVTLHPVRDGYVDEANPNTRFENGTQLLVSNTPGARKHSFIRFDTDDLVVPGRLVYEADLMVRNITREPGAKVDAAGVTAAWPNQLKWINQPSVGPVEDDDNGPAGSLFTFDVGELYHRYLSGAQTDEGVRLSANKDASFRSSESGGADRPALALTFNDLPASPELRSPSSDVVETEAPALRITSIPTDPNGDPVLVRFQVSTSQSAFAANVVVESPFTDQRTYNVAPGVLMDGETYYWRVQARDVCNPPASLCSLTDAEGTQHAAPSSEVRALQIALAHLGADESYPMWTHELGNNMMLGVNESNGNAYLSLPFDTRQSRSGDIAFGLAYNSQDPGDAGLGAGWDVYAGPAGQELPVRVKELRPAPSTGVKLILSDGERRYFALRDERARSYLPIGAGTGEMDKAEDGTYIYEAAEGGTYTFDAKGRLSTARFAGTDPDAAAEGEVLTYAYNAKDRVTSVTDGLGRAIRFIWTPGSAGTLDSVSTWDGAVFDVNVSTDEVEMINPAGDQVEAKRSFGLLTEVRDGEVVDRGNTGWLLTYDANGRVASAKAPDGGASSSSTPWTFEYQGPFHGRTASTTIVTDPRGPLTGDPGDFRTMLEFNTVGLPIRETGPADQTGYLPVATMLYDANHNLVCERSREANARQLLSPSLCGNDNALLGPLDHLADEYTYQTTAPFRQTSMTRAAPDIGGDRADSSSDYDQNVTGAKVITFDTADLSGEPVDQRHWQGPMSEAFGTGGPPGVTSGNSWSMRFRGYLHNDSGTDQTYRFRFATNDGVRLVVAESVLLDCFADNQNAASPNCGSAANPSITLPDGFWPIQIRYGDLTGTASFDFAWNGGAGNTFQAMAEGDIAPRVGLPTDDTSAPVQDGSRLDTEVTFAGDAKITRIATRVVESDGTDDRRAESDADEFGRIETERIAAGLPEESETTYEYAADSMCAIHEVSPTGAVTDRTCNARGQVTQETLHVRAVFDQPAQDRTTSFTYDPMGRLLVEDPPGDAITTHSYDDAGREVQTDMLVDASPVQHQVTDSVFDDSGRLTEQTATDAGTVIYDHDWADNEVSATDPRDDAFVTQTTFDALNREIAVTTPSGLLSTTEYVLSDGGLYVNETRETDPAGVASVTVLDVLGRETSYRTGSFDAETYSYDEQDNQVQMVDSAGVATEEDYSAYGDLRVETAPFQGPGDAVTTRSYDPQGRETEMDGPRSGVDDRLVFGYDGDGRLTSVQQAGLPAPNTNQMVYDDAGEMVRIVQPMQPGQVMVRTFSFDERGNQVSATDARGTTTMGYNAASWETDRSTPSGFLVSSAYDAQGRLTFTRMLGNGYTDPPMFACRICAKRFTFDEAGNILTAIRDGMEIDLSYDEDNRLVTVDATNSGGVPASFDETAYEFNSIDGHLDQVTTRAGTTSFGYNANGLLSAVTDPFTGQVTSYSYDGAGRVTGRTDPAQLTWVRTYEAATGMVDTQTITGPSGTVGDFDLSYDEAGNVVSRLESVAKPGGGLTPGSGTWSYSYDDQNRMVSATDPDSVATSYGYDNTGNRTSVQVGADPAVTTTYDDAGLPLSESDGTAFTHDAIGNLRSIDEPGGATGDRCYWYDGFDLLRSVAFGATTGCNEAVGDVVWDHDPLDRVYQRLKAPGGPILSNTLHFYEGTGEMLSAEEEAGAGSPTTMYANSGFGPLAQSDGLDTAFFTRDLHGDTMSLVDTAGTVTGSQLYSPWGEPTGQSGNDSVLGFQSQYTDADTGFVDMTTRLYGPGLGRFTTRDVLFGDVENPGSMNQFGYGEENPLSKHDVSGLSAQRVGARIDSTHWQYRDLYNVHVQGQWRGRVALGASLVINGDNLRWAMSVTLRQSGGVALQLNLRRNCRDENGPFLGTTSCSNGWQDWRGSIDEDGPESFKRGTTFEDMESSSHYVNFLYKVSCTGCSGWDETPNSGHFRTYKMDCSAQQCRFRSGSDA
ncbi:MAG: RHS repeat-associated core domain-containing protein [Actinomycetota bacterium]